MPYWEEPKYNDPDEIDGPEDVTLPGTMHHMQAKAELDLLVQAGALDEDEAHSALKRWKARGELDTSDRVEAALDVLASEGADPDEVASELRERAS
jgi:hypothetical protein